MFVSCVHPVIILSAVFCTVCNLFSCVLDIVGDQIVLAYSSMGRVSVLYVVLNVSVLFPQLLDVSALSILIVLFAFSVVFLICWLYVSFGSRCSPKSLVCLFVGMLVLFICSCTTLIYSLLSPLLVHVA